MASNEGDSSANHVVEIHNKPDTSIEDAIENSLSIAIAVNEPRPPRKISRPGSASSNACGDSKYLLQLLDDFVSAPAAPLPTVSIPAIALTTTETAQAVEMLPHTVQHIERFIMMLVMALQGFGCPTHLLEFHAVGVAKGLGHPAVFAIFPNYIITTFAHAYQNSNDGATEVLRNPAQAQTVFIPTSPGTNIFKLQLVKELCLHIAGYAIDNTDKPIPESVGVLGSWHSIASQRISVSSRKSLTELKRNFELLETVTSPLARKPSTGFLESERSGFLKSKPKKSESDLEPVEEEQEGSDLTQLEQLKQYILHLAKSGPGVYSRLHKERDALSKSQEFHKGHHHNAFALIAVEDAASKLEEIIALKPLYPVWARIVIPGIMSGGICGLFFGGSPLDMFMGFGLGAVVAYGGMVVHRPFDKTYEFLVAVFISAFVRTLIHWHVPICYTATTISAVIPLLQGVSLTLAMIELTTRSMVAGTARLFTALTMTTLIGFGLDFGLELTTHVIGLTPKDLDMLQAQGAANMTTMEIPNYCGSPVDPAWKWIIFPATAIAMTLSANAHWKQIPGMVITAFIAYIVPSYYARALDKSIGIALASFLAGVFSNVYSYFTGVPGMVQTYGALYMLVPGAMALRSVTALMGGSDPTSSMSLVGGVLSVSLSIGMGLFLATTATAPLTQWADHAKGRHRRVDYLGNLEF